MEVAASVIDPGEDAVICMVWTVPADEGAGGAAGGVPDPQAAMGIAARASRARARRIPRP